MSADNMGREQFLLVRFDFLREPGIRSSGVGIVKDSDPFNWFQGEFYVATSMASFQTVVDRFTLNSRKTEVQKMLMEGLNEVEYLVLRHGGERATFDEEDLSSIDLKLRSTQPLFDEYAILQDLLVEPHLRDFLGEDNTFGTWSDACLFSLIAYTGVELLWKKVGTDGALLPLQSKRVQLRQHPTNAGGGRSR
ncbi:hypothetical protein DM02DRAFT_7172 [Periconia macrospinosa]|uniref:Uncharacterized protein n=1 Tax=Periconia macrospinosa TaxID=97972 RepID=A0A2V1EEV6_9PLEO|nr:hypothetical protein DM02DRAFT_7172 [Periconia macrospinosa]